MHPEILLGVYMKKLIALLSFSITLFCGGMDRAPLKRIQSNIAVASEERYSKKAHTEEQTRTLPTGYITSPLIKFPIPDKLTRTIIGCFDDGNFEEENSDTRSITAFLNGKIIGEINFSLISLSQGNRASGNKIGCINDFYIKERYRKRGFGFDLFKKAYEYLSQQGALEIKWVMTLSDQFDISKRQSEIRTIFKNITAKLKTHDLIESKSIAYAGRVESLFTLPLRYKNEAQRPQELSSIPLYHLEPVPEYAHLLKKPKAQSFFSLKTYAQQPHKCLAWLQNDYDTSEPQWDPVEEKETITATHKNREVGHITFSDNINGKDTDTHATHGFIHEFEVVPELRGQHIGTDLFIKACNILKQRGVCLVTWYATAPIAEPQGLIKLAYIFRGMVQSGFSCNRFSMREILFNGTHVGRRMQIQFKDEPKRIFPQIRTKEQALAARTPSLLASEKELTLALEEQTVPLPVDFLKECICEEKKSGDAFPGKPELEFTIPVADDLYENSYSIDLREVKTHKIAAQVTYGQELDQKDVGAIHYFYMKPAFFSKGIGYPFFKHAIDQLVKLGYKKITWQALVQKPEMTRASLHKSIQFFALHIEKNGFSSLIDATSKEDFVTLQLMVPGLKEL